MDTQQMEEPRKAAHRVAVIILNWNGSKLLREYLPQVMATTDLSLSRVIVADNGSSDDSLEYVKATFGDKVDIMAFPENYGFAEGYNKALALASEYEYAVLLNSDVATSQGWDRALADYMDSHSDVGACQPKILSYKHRDTFEYAGACGGFLDKNGYPYCRGGIFSSCEKDHGQYDSEADLFWASGACLMVRLSLYLEAGGLDTRFFAHMEEIDLCWRIRLMGYRIAVVPSAVVYHLGGGSLPAENPRKTYLNFRNNLLMLHKNLPDSVRGKRLFIRRLLDTVAWAKYVASFDFANAAAIFRAHRDFAEMRKHYPSHPDTNLLGGPNILLDYYLRGHKKYSDLRLGGKQ